jgi:hypothetical protein
VGINYWPFHGENRGSIPLGRANEINDLTTLRVDPAAAGDSGLPERTGKITKICFDREEPIPLPRH